MSNWDLADYFEQQDAGGNPRKGVWKWTRWRDPFKEYENDIQTLACEGELLADIKMVGLAFGQWAFTNLVPSPAEITRKTVIGKVKCGFTLKLRSRQKPQTIWKSIRLGRFVAKIVSTAFIPIFYMWAMQTIWSFLSTWNSLIHAKLLCEADNNTCIAGGMVTPISIEGDHLGEVAAGFDIFDPNGWHDGLSGDIFVPSGTHSTCTILLTVTGVSARCDSITFELGTGASPNFNPLAREAFSIDNGEQNEVHLAFQIPPGGPTHWRCLFDCRGMQKIAPLGSIQISCARMIVRSAPAPPDPCTNWTPTRPISVTLGG